MRLGIDLGGTKIAAAVLDDDGEVRFERRVATPRDDLEGTVQVIVELVGAAEAELGVCCSVGVGMPGTLSPTTGLVKNANSIWLNGSPFDRRLAEALGREVRCANDADCLAVSEATDGAGAGEGVVFAAILGTGVGAGVALLGRPHSGRNGVAGEWGHNPLPWMTPAELAMAPMCYCGRQGCIETWLSGPGLARDHERTTGQRLDGPTLVAAARAGDAPAAGTVERHEERLSRALAAVINVLDPDVVVLGGGLSRMPHLYEGVPRRLPKLVFGGEATTPLRPALHGDASGVRGAAWLWPPG